MSPAEFPAAVYDAIYSPDGKSVVFAADRGLWQIRVSLQNSAPLEHPVQITNAGGGWIKESGLLSGWKEAVASVNETLLEIETFQDNPVFIVVAGVQYVQLDLEEVPSRIMAFAKAILCSAFRQESSPAA
ncbi:MAG: hypothetical protein WCD57_16835 [Acidobacteriaceae bacterium]